MNDEYYINRCIQISKAGISLASPNPSVGAVLVFKNKIIGEGFTSPFGGAHAEVNCIESVLEEDFNLIPKSTLYVSLEPCSHIGKTGACSTLIIEKGIRKVIVGSLDPNQLVAGNGIKMLKEAGIKVKTGVLKQECKTSNKRFYTFHQKKRPFIILKWAQTKNGYFSPVDSSQFWITNKHSKQIVHQWRSEEMAILVGKNTAEIDNPQLNSRLYSDKNPIRIVLDRNLGLSNNLYLFDKKQSTLVFNALKSEEKENLEYIEIDYNKNVIQEVLDVLFEKAINSIIIEGGLETLNAFIKQNLWDEARILTGENELPEGLKAPDLSGLEIENFNLKGDNVKIISNNIMK